MSEGKRPGGLTALAVFNFIGCGLDLLGVLGAVFLIFVLQSADFKEAVREAEAREEAAKTAKEAGTEPETAEPNGEPKSDEPKSNEEVQFDMFRKMGLTVRNQGIKIGLYSVLILLLLLSGIGYLKQKKFMGRKLGTIYAVVSLCTTYWELSLLPSEFRTGSATIGIVIAGVYPVITLLLINTIFKEDFTN